MSNIERKGVEKPEAGEGEQGGDGEREARVFGERIRRFEVSETGPNNQLEQLREELNQEDRDDPEAFHVPLDYKEGEEQAIEVKRRIPTEFPQEEELTEDIPLQTDSRKKPKTWWNKFKMAIALGTTAANLEQAAMSQAAEIKPNQPPVYRMNSAGRPGGVGVDAEAAASRGAPKPLSQADEAKPPVYNQNAAERAASPNISAVEKIKRIKERAKEIAKKSGAPEGARLSFKLSGGVPTEFKVDGAPFTVLPSAYTRQEWDALYTGDLAKNLSVSGDVAYGAKPNAPIYQYEQGNDWKKFGTEVKIRKPDLVEDLTGKDPREAARAVREFERAKIAAETKHVLDPKKKARAEWLARENTRLQNLRDKVWKR